MAPRLTALAIRMAAAEDVVVRVHEVDASRAVLGCSRKSKALRRDVIPCLAGRETDRLPFVVIGARLG